MKFYLSWTARLHNAVLVLLGAAVACSNNQVSPSSPPRVGDAIDGKCELDVAGVSADTIAALGVDAATPNYLHRIGCTSDFDALASVPMDLSLPGARSGKVALDTAYNEPVYFQNSKRYQIHWEFVSSNLPIPGTASAFEETQYYLPEADRRFLLGTVTYYSGPNVWTLELAPYDTATPPMIAKLFNAVKASAFFGPALRFHPTSDALELTAQRLTSTLPIITTNELYGAIDYQPLVLATAMGQLKYYTATDVASGVFIPHDTIAVLDQAPNDISVVAGIITEQFQSPLSHVNVLSSNRHTPNMGLRNASTREDVAKYLGKWVKLTVGSARWNLEEVSADEAAAYYAAHKPAKVTLPSLDTSVRGLWDIEEVIPGFKNVSAPDARSAIRSKVPAFGGKAANYSVLAQSVDIPTPRTFAIPVYYYDQFMRNNGLYDLLDRLIKDSDFQTNPMSRQAKLSEFRNAFMTGTIDQDLQEALRKKLASEFVATNGRPLKMRFRTSTNSEDLDAFPCAGCYESQSGDPAKGWDDVLNAIRLAYASAWLYRTYEERDYYGVDQKSVGMALLVHHTFTDETANGVAITANQYDSTGLNPAFYVNVETGGDAEVVHLPPGITADQFLYYRDAPNQPISFITHSNLVPAGTTVLTNKQVSQLATALDAIHELFRSAYQSSTSGFYAMDVEFKFAKVDALGNATPAPLLWIKQARPYPGRGTGTGDVSSIP